MAHGRVLHFVFCVPALLPPVSFHTACETPSRYLFSRHVHPKQLLSIWWTIYTSGVQTQSWRPTVLQSLTLTCFNTPAWKFVVCLETKPPSKISKKTVMYANAAVCREGDQITPSSEPY